MEDVISIIVPVYKVEAYLDECIQSIVQQTYSNLEIILVDDGSPDSSGAKCDDWAGKDNRIKVIHKENGGLSDARNAGLDIATGDYIAFVDSDDWILPEMYERLLSTLRKENADICACNILACYSDQKVNCGCSQYVVGDSEKILSMLYADTVYPVSALNKVYHRSLWEKFRFPVGKICEDAFTTYLLIDKAEKIVQIPEALYCYRIRENSIMTSKFSAKKMDEEEAWKCNYEFIAIHYPKLKKAAFDFYLQKVMVLLKTIPKDERNTFRKEYQTLRRILKQNLWYILFKSQIKAKQRIKLVIDYFSI